MLKKHNKGTKKTRKNFIFLFFKNNIISFAKY
jgi:hypothetical protein